MNCAYYLFNDLFVITKRKEGEAHTPLDALRNLLYVEGSKKQVAIAMTDLPNIQLDAPPESTEVSLFSDELGHVKIQVGFTFRPRHVLLQNNNSSVIVPRWIAHA